MKSITSKISIIILSLMASTFTFAEDKAAEEWLFVHTADEAQVTNNTTIVMPVTHDIFAFTDKPSRKFGWATGGQFASLWAKSNILIASWTDPPNAILTWVEGQDVNNAQMVITGTSTDGNSLTYTAQILGSPFLVDRTVKAVKMYVYGGGVRSQRCGFVSGWVTPCNE
jgi:hypothetical protein